MNPIMTVVGAAALTYLLTTAEPVQWLLARAGISPHSNNVYLAALGRLLSCCLCLGLWVGLAATHSITLASITAVMAEIISRLLNKVPLD